MTERTRSHPANAALPDEYRVLVESVVDYAIFMLDRDGYVLSWNPGAERINGYEAHEIIGQHFSKFYPPEDIAAGKPAHELDVAAAAGRVEDEGYRLRRDGSRFWASVIITALRDDSGALQGYGKVTRDLSERRANEEKLRRSEERFRLLLENVTDYAIYMLDPEGRVTTWNLGAERMKGYPAREILGKSFEVFFPASDIASGKPARELAMAREKGRFEDEGYRVRKDGTQFWANAVLTALHDERGELIGYAKITRDLTDRRAAEVSERRLLQEQAARAVERRQELRWRILADASVALGASLDRTEMLASFARSVVPALADSVLVFLGDAPEHVRLVAAEHIRPEKLPSLALYATRTPAAARARSRLVAVLRSGKPELHAEVTPELLEDAAIDPEDRRLLNDAGVRSLVMAPLSVRNQTLGALALLITESDRRYDSGHLALAEELGRRVGVALENSDLYRSAQQAAQAAEEASRAKDEFLATVSHELRTPLSAILGWSQLLKERLVDPAVLKPVSVIHRNAVAQVKIIDDILDVSRIITGKLRLDIKQIDLVPIARDAVEVVRPSALAKRIELEFEPETPTCRLVGDPERLQQVVWNLLSNAVKFTGTGGRVRLTVGRAASAATLVVSDTGMGIEPSFLPFVFDRFRQADSSTTRRVGGLGLGLGLVRHLVELHGGSVEARSEGLGHGATFTIRLPIRVTVPPPVPSAEAALTEAAAGAPACNLEGVKVLVVDDEPDARELVSAILLQRGARVETAASSAEGLRAVESLRPDVVVSDIGMPDEDGLTFIRRLRALPRAGGGLTPALALTAFAREEDAARALAAGYSAHLGKPTEPVALMSAVARLASRA